MEDDDEIQSHPSTESGSPASPGSPASSGSPNGRIRVTVASVPPSHPPAQTGFKSSPSSSSQNILTLALPSQQPGSSMTKSGSGTGGGGRDDCWSEGATSVLIDAWGERYLELSRGNLKQTHWKEVAAIVASRDDYSKTSKTDVQCKNRIDTVKKKYKLEKSKIAAGGGPSTWQFFHRLEHLIGPSTGSKIPPPVGVPVGLRSASAAQRKQKMQFRRRARADSESDDSPVSSDSLPPPVMVKKPKIELKAKQIVVHIPQKGGDKPNNHHNNSNNKYNNNNSRSSGKGNSVKELTQAIVKLGQAYEQAETLKMQQVVEMEKQRMKFAKDLELQRMQFFMKTQMEISQLKMAAHRGNDNGGGSSGGGGRRTTGNNHHHSTINSNMMKNNDNNHSTHSDSSD